MQKGGKLAIFGKGFIVAAEVTIVGEIRKTTSNNEGVNDQHFFNILTADLFVNKIFIFQKNFTVGFTFTYFFDRKEHSSFATSTPPSEKFNQLTLRTLISPFPHLTVKKLSAPRVVALLPTTSIRVQSRRRFFQPKVVWERGRRLSWKSFMNDWVSNMQMTIYLGNETQKQWILLGRSHSN